MRMKKILSTLALVFLFLGYLPTYYLPALNSATLSGGSAALSDSRPGGTAVSYTFDFDNVTLSSIKCIKVVLSDAATGGAAPTGIVTTGVTYSATNSDYIPDAQTWTAAEIVSGSFKITNATGEIPASATNATVQVTGITNGSTAETTYYAQFSTYDNIDCATTPRDSGAVAFIYATGQAVSATVDPSLSMNVQAVASGGTVNGATTNITTTDGTIPFATIATSTNKIAAHDVLVGTNAGSGYTLYIRYTQTFNDAGTNDINNHTGTNAAPTAFSAAGTEAFGYTTNDGVLGTGTTDRFTSAGGNKWAAFSTSNVEVGYSASSVSETTRVGYQAGVSSTTAATAYSTTVVLTATPLY